MSLLATIPLKYRAYVRFECPGFTRMVSEYPAKYRVVCDKCTELAVALEVVEFASDPFDGGTNRAIRRSTLASRLGAERRPLVRRTPRRPIETSGTVPVPHERPCGSRRERQVVPIPRQTSVVRSCLATTRSSVPEDGQRRGKISTRRQGKCGRPPVRRW